MDISNLKARQFVLIDFLKNNGFSKDVRSNIMSCIRMVLDIGCNPEIKSYQDLFYHVIRERGIENKAPSILWLKHGLGTVWAFDSFGKLPDNKPTGFLSPGSTADSLNPHFKALANRHLAIGGVNGKREKTVRTEYNAVVKMYAHFQKEGAKTIEDVSPNMVFSFFHDGEKQLRGADYRNLVRTALKAVEGIEKVAAENIISWLPQIKRSRKLFDFLSSDEGNRIRLCLEDEGNNLSSFERAVGWILYFYGLRGSDIANLKLENIDWVNDRICLIQSKTGYPLSLPLNATVGNSLFDYITTRTPEVSGPGPVFLPKRNTGNLRGKITVAVMKIFKTAGVRVNSGEKGVRVFRHHFVTHLLSNGVLCDVVTKLVGHRSPESIKFYADADYEHLKECAIDISSYPVDEKIFLTV